MGSIKKTKETGDLLFRTDWCEGIFPIIYSFKSIGFSEYDYIPNLKDRQANETYYTQESSLDYYVWRGLSFFQDAEIWIRICDYATQLL